MPLFPFKTLQAALKAGSELFGARKYRLFRSVPKVRTILEDSFPHLNIVPRDKLLDISIAAAQDVFGFDADVLPSGTIPLERLPSQPFLPTELTGGADSLINVEIATPSGAKVSTSIGVNIGDTFEQLFEQALRTVDRICASDPKRCQDFESVDRADLAFAFVFGERTF